MKINKKIFTLLIVITILLIGKIWKTRKTIYCFYNWKWRNNNIKI